MPFVALARGEMPTSPKSEFINGIQVLGAGQKKDARYWTEWHLLNWAKWQRTGGKPSGFGSAMMVGGALTQDFDDMCAHADRVVAIITDSVIRDLTVVEKCALSHEYLDAVYRFDREPFERVVERAKSKVQSGLLRRGVNLGD